MNEELSREQSVVGHKNLSAFRLLAQVECNTVTQWYSQMVKL